MIPRAVRRDKPLRHRISDREIADLRREKDELTDVIRRFDEYVDDYNGVLESWKETFDIKMLARETATGLVNAMPPSIEPSILCERYDSIKSQFFFP